MPRIKKAYSEPKKVEIEALKVEDPSKQHMTPGEKYVVAEETGKVLVKAKRAKLIKKLYVE